MAAHFAPPHAASVTGAAIAAHLRREGYDWRERLRALSVPTLVIHGERDALPAAVALELSELLPRARHALLPDAGHMPFWEAPERFFDVAGSFLAAPSTGPPRKPP
jgi:pimeloyl-ACP methyl ester carboxylesterase